MSEDGSTAKGTVTGLAKRLGKLPPEQRRAALEVSAALAAVSLRVSREFVEAVGPAAAVLSAEELREWGELGRHLTMGSAETGAKFFKGGVVGLIDIVPEGRRAVFEVCTRQLVLSSSAALKTFDSIPSLAAALNDKRLFAQFIKLAVEVARRSAKHSADLLEHTPGVARALSRFDDADERLVSSTFDLASEFANRTGGMTADLWKELPDALAGLSLESADLMLGKAAQFLEFGGTVTLGFISSAGSLLRIVPEAFEAWNNLSRGVAKHGNAVLIAFLRSTPRFFAELPRIRGRVDVEHVQRVLELCTRIASSDAESALAAFRSSTKALKKVSLGQFEDWIEKGINDQAANSSKARRSYFALETRESNEQLQKGRAGVSLESVHSVLRMYVEGLTGREVEIAPQSAMAPQSRIGDGKTIYLPSSISEFGDDALDFRLFKVLAAHGAGQIEFETFGKDGAELSGAYGELKALYSAADFASDKFRSGADEPDTELDLRLPAGSDYNAVLALFPEPRLARKIFGTMENARIGSRLRQVYRGLRKDLDLMQEYLRRKRPYIFDVPMSEVPFELLFQITMCGGATDDARQFYSQVVSEIETVIETFLTGGENTVADSIMATSRVYSLFQNIFADQTQQTEADTSDTSEFAYESKDAAEAATQEQIKREPQEGADDIRDLFDAWNSLDDDGEPDDLTGGEAWGNGDVPEQALEKDDLAFAYDEWDRELGDYRVGWSRVIEKKVKQGDRSFVELTRSHYRGVISSIRHQFQLMKPENLTRINRELDGEDYDLNALVDFVIDRRADGKQAENIYTKRLRKQRDVAVSILLDQSSSTARTITRNPLQPYTHPGRRIIEIEKEGLVLMSEALEAVGDAYSINGFTSEGRRNVKFYVVKDFDEKYSEDTERRIGGITFQNNTRLGAAIRHAAAKIGRLESRTKLLIILTDGRPYDHDYGDGRYAREDVREALIEAKSIGITPFCITVDRESESELRDLYGDVGYTIIDDILSLPERMPGIYRRLTR